MPRKSIGETAMTDAERQARYRVAHAPAGRPSQPAPAAALRYGRRSLPCMTWISPEAVADEGPRLDAKEGSELEAN